MRTFVAVILIMASSFSFAQDDDPLSVVKAYLAAQHGRDVDAEIDLCHPQIIFTITGAFRREGIEEMRGISEWDAVLNGWLVPDSMEVIDSVVTCSGVEKNDWFAAVGIDEVKYKHIEFSIAEGMERGKRRSISSAFRQKTYGHGRKLRNQPNPLNKGQSSTRGFMGPRQISI